MKVHVSYAAFERAVKSLTDPVLGDPSKSEFYAAYNIIRMYGDMYIDNGFTIEFSYDADATLFLLRFS
jgi:hypothetical protein